MLANASAVTALARLLIEALRRCVTPVCRVRCMPFRDVFGVTFFLVFRGRSSGMESRFISIPKSIGEPLIEFSAV